MANKISLINDELLEIHNILTGNNHKMYDIEKNRSKIKLFEPLIHDNGVNGKLASGDSVDSTKYYSLLDLI
jgi:hypothetical protein